MHNTGYAERVPPRGRALAALSLGALGVVYGDIGTSPLYALRECFKGVHSVPPTPANILGVLSLVFWAINFVVSFKYISFVMRADNRGEGGILALLALVRPRGGITGRHWGIIGLGLFGAALLYGDGIITPAVSVLGALEGISVATPAFERYVPYIAAVILAALFWVQRRGTAGIGRVFGPIMVIWFLCIAALGVRGIALNPSVLKAANPWYAMEFFMHDGLAGFLILGSVVLVITGAEALYADMGHFGKRPIRLAWFCFALPALLLNYFGQSALLLTDPLAADNPFYSLVPPWALYPMVGIATLAAIVASQALISGAFSLTRQAVQLGYSPRVTVVHTSRTEMGQIYIPEVNGAIGIACIILVLTFQRSTNLAAAYGIAVTGTMIITTILFHRVARRHWGWGRLPAGLLTGLFLVVDVAFFAANMVKVKEGGWFPLAVAAVVFTLMTTWKRGRDMLSRTVKENSLPIDLFLASVARDKPHRVSGTAVFLTSVMDGAPPVLLHHLKHNKVLHEIVILLSIVTEEIPQVSDADRVDCKELGEGFYQVIGHYGFMESPDVPAMLSAAGLATNAEGRSMMAGKINVMQMTFYLGRETLIATRRPPGMVLAAPADAGEGPLTMSHWRKKIFILMTRNARSATAFFNLPPNRVVELGAQIQI